VGFHCPDHATSICKSWHKLCRQAVVSIIHLWTKATEFVVLFVHIDMILYKYMSFEICYNCQSCRTVISFLLRSVNIIRFSVEHLQYINLSLFNIRRGVKIIMFAVP
jgi:hypothetical protein